jgi:hypothetical protein
MRQRQAPMARRSGRSISRRAARGPVSVSSIPITVTAANGGALSNVSNCQLANASGTLLNTGANLATTTNAGSGTFTLDQPLALTGGQTTSLTVRCNVASSTPSGATFQFVAQAAGLLIGPDDIADRRADGKAGDAKCGLGYSHTRCDTLGTEHQREFDSDQSHVQRNVGK